MRAARRLARAGTRQDLRGGLDGRGAALGGAAGLSGTAGPAAHATRRSAANRLARVRGLEAVSACGIGRGRSAASEAQEGQREHRGLHRREVQQRKATC